MRGHVIISGIVFLSVLSSCGPQGEPLARGVISYETRIVDSVKHTGQPPSLAFNSSGDPLISYEDDEDGSLKIAERTGVEWRITPIEGGMKPVLSGDVVSTSLVVNASGSPYICYINRVRGQLKIAFRNNRNELERNTWEVKILDQGPGVGPWASMKMDNEGRAHISYFFVKTDPQNPERIVEAYPRYIVFDGENVPVAEIIDSGLVGAAIPDDTLASWLSTSLVMAPDGTPLVTYYDPVKRSLNIARKLSGGQWEVLVIDTSPERRIGQSHSMIIDSRARLHVSYTDTGLQGDSLFPSTLKYAVFNGDLWNRETVDSVKGESKGAGNSITLGPDSSPIISYMDATSKDIKIAFLRGGAWHIFRLDSAGPESPYSSISGSPGGDTGVAYFQNSEGKSPPRWVIKFSLVEY